ncbi:MAG: Toluene efflux pump outer membrane protein TtgI precursor [Syntrophus sp. PtaU1.Bin208]|nr:MAG: Toluene efflux pump outer membrane protein TtgI precursor [Syntrophus sp. PtaU1.Bin208]
MKCFPVKSGCRRIAAGFSAVMAIVLILGGCATVGPDYVPPQTDLTGNWHTPLKGGLNAKEENATVLAEWWTTLNDPELSSLIKRAVAGNRDLKKAGALVREARANRGVTRAGLFPTVDASGSATRSRSSEETGAGKTGNFYVAGLDAGWELDLFGGVRRSVEAADADLQASQEDLRDVLISLLAEVALNYVDVRTYQARLSVAESNLSAQSETFDLTSWRQQAGLSDELAVQQARYNLESTRSQIPTLRTGLEEAKNNLAVLLGEQPGKIHEELEERRPTPAVSPSVAVGVPADVLRQRPDVRKAERQLAAQTARIGVAKSELYPKFTLSGSIGLEALSSSDLFSWGSRTGSGGIGVTWRIFDAGAIRQNIEAQTALQEQYLMAYETAVLNSLKEVENALTAYAEEEQRRQALQAAVQAAQKAAEQAGYKYQTGLADFDSVLEAQRSLLNFQDQLAQSDGTVISNLIRLYKALGGGWTSLAADEKNQSILKEEKK